MEKALVNGINTKIEVFNIVTDNIILQNSYYYYEVLEKNDKFELNKKFSCPKRESRLNLRAFKAIFATRSFHNCVTFVICLICGDDTQENVEFIKTFYELLSTREDLKYATKILLSISTKKRSFNELTAIKAPNNFIIVQLLHCSEKKLKHVKTGNIVLFSKTSIQEQIIAAKYETESRYGKTTSLNWFSTTRSGCFVDAINPAIAIIINTIDYTTPNLNIRNGSSEDVLKLMKLFSQKKIPQIVFEDADISSTLDVFDFLQNMDFSSLRDVYLIISSHGIEGDVIVCRGGEYGIYDKVKKFSENKTLRNTNKVVVVSACRGTLDPKTDESEIDEVTDASMMDNKTLILHSAPKHFKSLRVPLRGTIFIDHFLNAQKLNPRDSDELVNTIKENVDNCEHYSFYDGKKFDSVKNLETKMQFEYNLQSRSKVDPIFKRLRDNFPVSKNKQQKNDEKNDKVSLNIIESEKRIWSSSLNKLRECFHKYLKYLETSDDEFEAFRVGLKSYNIGLGLTENEKKIFDERINSITRDLYNRFIQMVKEGTEKYKAFKNVMELSLHEFDKIRKETDNIQHGKHHGLNKVKDRMQDMVTNTTRESLNAKEENVEDLLTKAFRVYCMSLKSVPYERSALKDGLRFYHESLGKSKEMLRNFYVEPYFMCFKKARNSGCSDEKAFYIAAEHEFNERKDKQSYAKKPKKLPRTSRACKNQKK